MTTVKETSEMLVLPKPCLQPSRSQRPQWLKGPRPPGTRFGSLTNHHNDNNDNVKKQLVLLANQQLCTCLTLFSTFFWRPLHDFDVKPRNATPFDTGREHPTTNFPFFFEPWFQIILAWSSPLRRLVLSNRNIEQINYPSTAVRSALPTIISVIRFYTSVLLILIYTLPRCCLFKWIFKNCSLKNSTPGKISYICQIERALLDAIKFESTQIRFFGNVFTTLVVVASSRVFFSMITSRDLWPIVIGCEAKNTKIFSSLVSANFYND